MTYSSGVGAMTDIVFNVTGHFAQQGRVGPGDRPTSRYRALSSVTN